MNERIRELAFQAGFVGESMNPIFGTCQETALKNFAELIVKECANVAGYYYTRNECVSPTQIKNHFGVEE